MDTDVVGTRGSIYHLLPHERTMAASFEKKFEMAHTKTGVLSRNGPVSSALRAAATANAMIVSLFSIALIFATAMFANRHPVSSTPYIINIVIYTAVAGPFIYLQWRRRLQANREGRAYRAMPPPTPDGP